MSTCSCHTHYHAEENIICWIRNYLRSVLSGIMLVLGIIADKLEPEWLDNSLLYFTWYLLAYLLVGMPVMKEAAESIRNRDYFSEFTLMCIATIGAFYIGEYPEGVAVMLFYSIGELFQERAVNKARRNIKALLDVRPDTATVLRDGKKIEVSPSNVRIGEVLEIKVGERVPLDGKMLNGEASFDTSALTGESMPREIQAGEEVLAGMIVADRVVEIEVVRPYEQSALARILELVQNASERKAPAELFIRKFARIYTPIVVVLAFLIILCPLLYSLVQPSFMFVFDEWLYKALVFLVISCPCALVISIPLGYFGGIGAASKQGILFKGGNYLDAITKVNTIAFDKTGTLTNARFDVKEVHAAEPYDEIELVSMIAAAEKSSNHPIAKAIMDYTVSRGIKVGESTAVKEMAGYGLSANIASQEILVGGLRLLQMNRISYPASLDCIPETDVACAAGGKYAGYILLADDMKDDAADTVNELKKLKIGNIEILSGDKQAIVSKLAENLGIAHAYGELLPEGKVKHLESLKADKTNNIAFVGDGINDAPVLAVSHVGIAMGGLGSDAAIETADVVIQTDQPSKVATAIRIGRMTRSIIWQNIALAFAVKLTVLILGAVGLATMWEAVFADVGVALLAILNAIRIQRKKIK